MMSKKQAEVILPIASWGLTMLGAAWYVIMAQDKKIKEMRLDTHILLEMLNTTVQHTPPEVVMEAMEKAKFHRVVWDYENL